MSWFGWLRLSWPFKKADNLPKNNNKILLEDFGIEFKQSEHGYSILNVNVPGEDVSATFLATLSDENFPRFRTILPKQSKILILDLDETLVHSTSKSCRDWDYMIEVLIEQTSCLYYVFKRPFVDHFLATVSNWFHLVIYTASLKEYAEPVVNWLDRDRKLFRKRLFRNSCIERDGIFLKDLSLVDSNPSRMALVDNSPSSFELCECNAIPIETWIDDRNDTALLDLIPFLDALRFVDDVRSILSLRTLK